MDATTFLAGAKLGTVELAAQSAAYYILYVLNALDYGINTAVTVRLGQHLGARMPLRARATVKLGLAFVLIISALLSILVVGVRDQIGRVFSSDPSVLSMISDVAPYVALAFFMNGIAGLMTAVLLAQARPTTVSLTTILCKWCIDLPLSFSLVLLLHHGLPGIWWGMATGNCSLAILLAIFVSRTNWIFQIASARHRSEVKDATPANEEVTERSRLLLPSIVSPKTAKSGKSGE